MANTKSALKRWRQSLKRRLRNRVAVGSTRTAMKVARESIATGGAEAADAVRAAVSRLDAAAHKGAIHRNAAARKKSRLMRHYNAAAAAAPAPQPAATPEAVMAEAKPARSRAKKAAPAAVAAAAAVEEAPPAKAPRSRAKKAAAE